MAEFKLGRIRFVWKNTWTSGTTYYKDDVVALGGKMYICVIGHTAASDFFTDLDVSPTKWNLVSDGMTWKGSWQTDTDYIYNDLVEYGGRVYICNTNHTSAATTADGLEVDQSKWTIFANGLDWKSDWATDVRYVVNDIVKYGGKTYVCITAHTSAATESLGLEQDQSKWQIFNAGIEYKSTWTELTRYKENDVIRYGAILWICTTPHTSTGVFANDVSNWEKYVQGFQFESEWEPTATYQPGDVVRYGGNQYIATQNHIEKNPETETAYWDLFSEGLRFKGPWGDDSTNQDYRPGDVVTLGAYTYICIAGHNGQEPPNATYWQQLNSGISWRGDWLDDQQYYLGDVVRFQNNSYICVLGHQSEGDDFSSLGGDANSRPDLDVTGTYWNIIAAGSETAVLTTKGDMVYYSGSGPVRLPIGANGQVLTVNSDSIPEWAYLGDAEDVYYVAEHGVDAPGPEYGRTIDRPWRSIRYAADQVDYGTKYPQARRLLELNRQFIQREIVEWTEWQIANAGVGSIWENFTYESTFCERDMGIIVDALVWDLTHGGNVKSREAAISYVTDAGGVYTNNQEGQTVAAIEYGLSVIGNVLAQTDPTTNYQTTNGDNSTAIVEQWKDELLVAESGALSRITTLTGIITDAVTAGNTSTLPERIITTNLIRVSTGKYYEVLPIIVPAETCILGDELRSTQVFPRKADNATLTPREDVQYSIKTIERLEEIIGDIIQGNAVTPTTGNTAIQDTSWPGAQSEEVIAVEQLARTLRRNIDHAIGDKNEWTYPLAGELSNTGNGYFRDLILANKEFLKAEILAYIADQYPTLKYSKTSCSRDVGLIVDAIAYDLTYGGNWQSINAGLAYFRGTNGAFVVDSTEKAATLASYTYLESLLETVGRNLTVTPVLNTAGVTQVSGTAGSTAAALVMSGLISDIKTIIDLGADNAPATTYPVITGASAALQSDSAALVSAKAAVQEAVIDFINTNFGTFTYDSSLCRRDAGLLKTGAAYDIGLGTNYNAVRDGLAYRRNMTAEVIANQLTPTVGAINYEATIVGDLLSDSTAISRNTAYWAEVIDIISNGTASANSLVFTDTGVAAKTTARTELQTNRASIISDLTTWINSTYPSLVYDEATCERDTGYIVDALSYDIQYGGNSATYEAARAYYTGAVAVLPAGQTAQTSAAFTQLKTIVNSYLSGATEETEAGGLLDIIIDVIDAGDTDSLPTKTYPSVTWATAGIQSDVSSVLSDTTVVPAVLQYITNTYSGFVYDHAKCSRDIGLIIDAARYDFCLGSNFASMVAAYSYLRAPSAKVVGDQKAATIAANEYARQLFVAEVSDPAAIAGVTAAFEFVNDMIFGGSAEGNMKQVDDWNVYSAIRQLELNKEFIVSEISAWMNYNYVNFNDYYTSATCARDIGMIVDAASYDLITGSNFASSIAGRAYYRVQSATVTSAQLTQTIAAIKQAKVLSMDYVDDTHRDEIAASFDNVLNILENGISAVPTFTFPDNGTTVADDSTSAGTFQSNRATYISSVSSYLNTNYNAQWTALGASGQATCQRDVGYIVDAVTYDVLYGGNYQSVIAGESYYSFGTLQIGAGAEKTATLAALGELKTLMVADAEAASQTVTGNLLDDVIDIVTNGSGSVATTYPSETGELALIQTSFTDLQADNATVQTAVTTYITDTFSSYTYNVALCERDVRAFIDAMKWDLQWAQEYRRTYTNDVTVILPAMYKTKLAARYYVNAVLGSQEEDFFYMRNGTGLRMMTLDGLQGDLTPENEFGTSRVTAGAYSSLDPGWGPDDERVWITARSPYMQNCTCFGYAAIGQKIDGALHNGGNDSMVSNDFTQLISDGIGAWITNNGRAELVSVFTYYSHIGYLAENGGRIRATNGNNSYGDFGSVAEGVDADEIPVTGIVDNVTQYRATISNVNTDQSAILNVEYSHAGNDYTQANITFFGPGDNEEVEADEFRDDGVYQVRLLDLDDSSGEIGGDGYTVVTNTAQDGNSTSITLAATDSSTSTAYIDMKILITAGNGVGQYALIDSYDSGTKIATIVKETTGAAGWDHLIPGTAIVNADSTSVYQIEPAISFSAPPSSSAAHTMPASNTWTDLHYFETSELFVGVSGTTAGAGTGATFDVERVWSKYFVTLNTGGTGYNRLETITIPGTSIGGVSPANDLVITLSTVNSTTGAVVDFDFAGEARGGLFLALSATTAGASSYDGETWSAMTMPAVGAGVWHRIADGLVYDGSTSYRPSYAVAVSTNSSNVAYTEDGITWASTTLPAAMAVSSVKYVAYGLISAGVGRFVVISGNDRDVAYSDDGGANWTLVANGLPATGYQHLTYGKGHFVAITNGGAAVYSLDGITWNAGSGLATETFSDMTYGANKFVAVASTNNALAYSLDGRNWSASTLPAIGSPTDYTRIEYGQGVFVATNASTGSTVVTSEDGIVWTQVSVAADPGTPSGHSAIAFGNPAKSGMFALTSAGLGKDHVVKFRKGCTAKGRPSIASEKIFEIRLLEPGSGYYSGAPTMTVTDPGNIYDINFTVRVGKGALANPSFVNRGTGFSSATADLDTIGSNGYANFYQDGAYVAVRRLTERPVPGSNVVFDSLPDQVFKLVNVVTFRGLNDGSYTAFLNISPNMAVADAPEDGDPVTMRIRYSQVRLTGHDFLDVGTGNFVESNYPGVPLQDPIQANETVDSGGGRVFYTSTDQDGNFRVGDLFTIEQATGIATLNAQAFNIAGLQELTLGQVTLGGNSASITEFSTDPFFTQNSDTVVPTQRAVKAYIESQIGGGGASLNVNSVTAGDILIGTNVISNVAGGVINIQANINFTGGVIGIPVAYNYFLR